MASGRDVRDVFKTHTASGGPQDMLNERFGSSGKHTVEQLEQAEAGGLRKPKRLAEQLSVGARVRVIGRYGQGRLLEHVDDASWRIAFDDGVEALVAVDKISIVGEEEEEVPQVDNRTLYEKLKEQKDKKQEEWEHANTFKNQMSHWRLDEDDAAFERERVERLHEASARKKSEEDEDLERYRLAMLMRTKPASEPAAVLPGLAPAPPRAGAAAVPGAPAPTAKRKAALPSAVAVRVVSKKAREGSQHSTEPSPATAAKAKPAPATSEAPPRLPGLDAYGDDSDDDSGADGGDSS